VQKPILAALTAATEFPSILLSQPGAEWISVAPRGRINRPSNIIGRDFVTPRDKHDSESGSTLSRRTLVQAMAACAGATVAGAGAALAQGAAVGPPTTITTPPRDFGPHGAPTTYFWDPDIIAVDPSFNGLAQPNTSIERLYTGLLWAEGPAWSAMGQYLVWSDIPNNRQMRWSADDGHVSVLRYPSNNSNGNTFDFQGRQLSCEHLTRRVVRYEHDGTVTVIADSYNGKKLNSPNDVVPHPDGSYWFTDPPYGGQLYEGEPDVAGGPTNAAGKLNPRIGQPGGFVPGKRELPTNCYRADPSGRIDLVVTEDQVPDPNGLVFSPDFKKLYVISTGKGPGDTGAGGKGDMYVFDVGGDNKLSNQKRFSDFVIDGVNCGPDGARCDVNGNLWVSSNAGRHVGYSGVTVWNPAGQLIGRIRLPEICGNVCFGGPKRNRLFMAASQSLYSVYTATQGAAPG
jgi:gluconolactonase